MNVYAIALAVSVVISGATGFVVAHATASSIAVCPQPQAAASQPIPWGEELPTRGNKGF